MKRRNFLASLFVVPTALKRLAKSKPVPKGLFMSQFHYAANPNPAFREMIFHQRDFVGKWTFTTPECFWHDGTSLKSISEIKLL